jgi:hypothetical protein
MKMAGHSNERPGRAQDMKQIRKETRESASQTPPRKAAEAWPSSPSAAFTARGRAIAA